MSSEDFIVLEVNKYLQKKSGGMISFSLSDRD